jgi:hypothetical protein
MHVETLKEIKIKIGPAFHQTPITNEEKLTEQHPNTLKESIKRTYSYNNTKLSYRTSPMSGREILWSRRVGTRFVVYECTFGHNQTNEQTNVGPQTKPPKPQAWGSSLRSTSCIEVS